MSNHQAIIDSCINWIVSTITCERCKHKWVAIYLNGTKKLECPECHCYYILIEHNPTKWQLFFRKLKLLFFNNK